MTYAVPEAASRAFAELANGNFEHEPGTAEQTAELTRNLSFADMEQIVLKAKRKAIIDDKPLSIRLLAESLEEYRPDAKRKQRGDGRQLHVVSS
ncbi:hypothetical protein BCM02_10382 [Paenibacillus methanolicus]|uniref:Uncharacterized protein n=2 Tax=Paenibacillus methanolicus TaxID=582686 RepID=A0A5S5CAI9_9BACL|nr:hypothetical protein BCM02_10382 [Paenibacillus methanolicus]